MQYRVWDDGCFVVEGFDDDGEALGVGGGERGQVRDQRESRDVRRVRDLQRPQRLALDTHPEWRVFQET